MAVSDASGWMQETASALSASMVPSDISPVSTSRAPSHSRSSGASVRSVSSAESSTEDRWFLRTVTLRCFISRLDQWSSTRCSAPDALSVATPISASVR